MLIVDTGVIVAATDTTDRHHQRCVALLETEPGPVVTSAMVIALAERLGQTRVATLDRRHFAVVRPTNCDAFDLIP